MIHYFIIIFSIFSATYAHLRLMIPEHSLLFTKTSQKSIIFKPSRQMEFLTDDDPNSIENNNQSVVTMSLFGGIDTGYYYTTLFIGNPPQRKTLIVDTGSSITTFPCQSCGDDCGRFHHNPQYNPRLSRTYSQSSCGSAIGAYSCNSCDAENQNQCKFFIGYTEGSSLTGIYFNDQVRFGLEAEQIYANKSTKSDEDKLSTLASLTVNTSIGCTLKETKLFYTQEADGILGLGIQTNSTGAPPNFIDFFGTSGDQNNVIFSLCYGEQGGYMSVGGYNSTWHDPNDKISYTPYVTIYGQYKVNLKKIAYGDENLDINERDLNKGQGAFFDSGTTLFYAPRRTINGMKNALEKYCSENDKNCGGDTIVDDCFAYDSQKYQTLEDFFDTFLDFKFHFDSDAVYEWKPRDYLCKDIVSDKYCLCVQEFSDRTILGGAFMKNHDILFDKKHSRIGFIKSDCQEFTQNSQSYYKDFRSLDFFSDKTQTNEGNDGINESQNNDKDNSKNKEDPISVADFFENLMSILLISTLFLGVYCLLNIIRARQNMNRDQRLRGNESRLDLHVQELVRPSNIVATQDEESRPKFSITDNDEGFMTIDENEDNMGTKHENSEKPNLQALPVNNSDDS